MNKFFTTLTVAAFVAAAAAVAVLCLFPVVSDDLFLYLYMGKLVTTTGSIPHQLGCLFTLPDYELEMNGEWLGCVVYYLIHQAGGIDGVIAFKTALVLVFVAAAALLLLLHRRLPPGAAAIVLLGGYAASDRFIARSSLFSDVFYCLLIAILLALSQSVDRPRRRNWLLAAIFLLFLLWGNINGGYWPALATIFCFFAGDALVDVASLLRGPRGVGTEKGTDLRKKLTRAATWIGAGVLAFGACFINPFFHRAVFFPFKLRQDAVELADYYGEYMPTFTAQNWRFSYQLQAFVLLVAAVAALLVWRRKLKPVKELLTAALLVYASTLFVRFIAFSALGLALLAVHLLALPGVPSRGEQGDEPRDEPSNEGERTGNLSGGGRRTWLCGTARCLELGACVVALVWFSSQGYRALSGDRSLGTGLNRDVQPAAVADYLEQNDLISARIYNQHEAGAYLIWRFDGRMKVFFHGWVTNNDFYFNEFYAANRSSADFARIAEKYGIEGFLLMRPPPIPPKLLPPLYASLYPNRNPARSPYRTKSPWTLVYWDNRYVLYLDARNPKFQAIIERDRYDFADPVMATRYLLGRQQAPRKALAEKERAKRVFPGLRLPPVWRPMDRKP